MQIRELLLPEFDEEMKKTRETLARVPEDKGDFKPHDKSAPLGKLAAHTAQLPEFAICIVETPSYDFGNSDRKPLVMESRQQLLAAFDDLVAKGRQAIASVGEDEWQKKWKLSFQGQTIVEAPRFQVYRALFLNHLIHHRAQLGVYLRLNDIPVPAIYGPSADDRMGF